MPSQRTVQRSFYPHPNLDLALRLTAAELGTDKNRLICEALIAYLPKVATLPQTQAILANLGSDAEDAAA
jgi:hypothetical protein